MVEDQYKDLAILTIASGTKGRTLLLHDFKTIDGNPLPTALTGLGKLSNIYAIKLDKTFGKNHNIVIPAASFILQQVTAENHQSLPFKSDDGSSISISAGLIIPVWLTQIIATDGLTEASDILMATIEYAKTSITALSLEQGQTMEETKADGFFDDLEESMIEEGDLIRQLFGWTRLNSKPLCLELTHDPAVDSLHEALQDTIAPPNQTSTHQSNPSTPNDFQAQAQAQADQRVRWNIQNPNLPLPVNYPPASALTSTQPPNSHHNLTTDPINKLMNSVIGLAQMQEESIKQQELIQQRKIDNQRTIHYTTRNTMLRLSTPDGISPAATITPLAAEMLGTKKKDISLNILLLSLNEKGVRAQITPQMLEAMCSGDLIPKKPFEPAPFSLFSCASSFAGTRLEELDIAIIFKRNQDESDLQPLSEKEKEALFQDTLIVVVSITQLVKHLNIFSNIMECYIGTKSLIAVFIRDWHSLLQKTKTG